MILPYAYTRRARAADAAGLVMAGLLLVGLFGTDPATAGDEDISPNAYQEFDPVTGYMITVDPDAKKQPGHGTGDPAGDATPGPDADASSAWIYWVAAGAVLAGGAVWLRSRLSGS